MIANAGGSFKDLSCFAAVVIAVLVGIGVGVDADAVVVDGRGACFNRPLMVSTVLVGISVGVDADAVLLMEEVLASIDH